MLEELMEKKRSLRDKLDVLGMTWEDLEEDLKITKEEYWYVHAELKQVEQEIEDEM